MIQINKTQRLRDSQFYPSSQSKSQIFLHHTAGLSAKSAIDWWNQTPDHVGTAYVIDRDGTIYETFDPDKWGYHLGIKGDDDYCEKHSIGIEIVSAGGLVEEAGGYFFYPLWPNKTQKREIPTDEVEKVNWGGWAAFHKYTEAQIKSIQLLIEYLLEKFPDIKNLKSQDWDPETFYQFRPSILKNHDAGIWSHSTVRKDKVDIYPCTELLEVIEAIYH